jgi:hypothetical protein
MALKTLGLELGSANIHAVRTTEPLSCVCFLKIVSATEYGRVGSSNFYSSGGRGAVSGGHREWDTPPLQNLLPTMTESPL